jgi:hypothetical protein
MAFEICRDQESNGLSRGHLDGDPVSERMPKTFLVQSRRARHSVASLRPRSVPRAAVRREER